MSPLPADFIHIKVCKPICAKLLTLPNKMVAPDHIHSLDLYILNNQTDIFELV